MSILLDSFHADITRLVKQGHALKVAMQLACFPERTLATLTKTWKEKADDYVAGLPSFEADYPHWYSQAITIVRQVLPERYGDFVRHFEKPKVRREITAENYRIEDYLQGLHVTRGVAGETLVGRDAAIPLFQQQLAILEAAAARTRSAPAAVRHPAQPRALESELEAAEHLSKQQFGKAAGSIAGMVLERHLAQVCDDHEVALADKEPTIADFSKNLQAASVIDIPQLRMIQQLADLRSLCEQARTSAPTDEQVADLISGVRRITRTVC